MNNAFTDYLQSGGKEIEAKKPLATYTKKQGSDIRYTSESSDSLFAILYHWHELKPINRRGLDVPEVVEVLKETEKAFNIKVPNKKYAFWIPKSCILITQVEGDRQALGYIKEWFWNKEIKLKQ